MSSMAHKALPTQTLPAVPVAPGDVAVWFGDLQRGLNRLFEAIDDAIKNGKSLSGFEHLTSDEAFSRIVLHLEESEMAAVFQLLACAEAQLHQCEDAAGPLVKRAISHSAGSTSSLDRVLTRIGKIAKATDDQQPLFAIRGWSSWRDWYAHGRRYEAVPPPAQIHFPSLIPVVNGAIACATDIVQKYGASLGVTRKPVSKISSKGGTP
jgi:hypothetical protein